VTEDDSNDERPGTEVDSCVKRKRKGGGNEKGKEREAGEPSAASGTLGDLTWLEDFLTSK